MNRNDMIKTIGEIGKSAAEFWPTHPDASDDDVRERLAAILKMAVDAMKPAKEPDVCVGVDMFEDSMACFAANGLFDIYVSAQRQEQSAWTINGWSNGKLRVVATVFGGKCWAKPVMQYIRNALVHRANRHHRQTVNRQEKKR